MRWVTSKSNCFLLLSIYECINKILSYMKHDSILAMTHFKKCYLTQSKICLINYSQNDQIFSINIVRLTTPLKGICVLVRDIFTWMPYSNIATQGCQHIIELHPLGYLFYLSDNTPLWASRDYMRGRTHITIGYL